MRGCHFQGTADRLDHTFGIGKHFIAPETDHFVALIFEPCCPSLIIGLLERMLAAVNFNYVPRTGRQKVYDVGAESDLAPKFDAL